ncbi:MAG: hypothetical protein O2973_02720 [Gemmatimonadetes bacterium]|nr:hypothetical protein [Gemmatimonadota bacterium]
MTESTPVPAAALAGVPAGVQAQGVWMGRRQLFVRFAGEAETATMYSATATLLEQAAASHGDCRLTLRLPSPAGLR